MGVSTDGIICMGVPFDEGASFIWDEETGETGQDALEKWWSEKYRDSDLPVEIVNYCSGGVPMYVLAVKGTVQECARGYPHRIQLPLERTPPNWEQYIRFLEVHLRPQDWEYLNEEAGFAGPEKSSGWVAAPGWLLCSYWDA